MWHWTLSFLLVLGPAPAFSEEAFLSARIERAPPKDYPFDVGSAQGSARPWSWVRDDANFYRRAPEGSPSSFFSQIRWDRFLEDFARPGRSRRIPWFYPDDGCFYRADKAVRRLRSTGEGAPAKVFAFGSLRVSTPNHPRGRVGWWYHVAPIIRDGGELYVLDPAIQLSGPLSLGTWLSRMSPSPGSLRVSICAASAYGPSSTCVDPSRATPDSGESPVREAASSWLSLEWSRVRSLGRDPYDVL